MRPIKDWHGFIGQAPIADALERIVAGSRNLGIAIPHIILLGLSGLGKTWLVHAVAAAFKTKIHEYICSNELTVEQLNGLSQQWSPGDILFFDEIHSLPRAAQEWLFATLDAKKLTVIIATDQPGSLLSAFKKRFPLKFTLEPYSVEEMVAIVRQRASETTMLLTPQAATAVARTCRGIPRYAGLRLQGLAAFHGQNSPREYATEHVRELLASLQIDSMGLERLDLLYLHCLAARNGRGASAQFMAMKLQCDVSYVMKDVEHFLLDLGFIDIDRRGRILTAEGSAYVSKIGEKAP